MPSPDDKLSIHALSGGAYWVGGGIANTGFIVGSGGVIAIDAQYFALTATNQLAEMAKITSKPVNTMILTHTDPDHVNGLVSFPLGMEIIAQENARTEMLQVLADPTPGPSKPPAELKDYLPTLLVKSREELVIEGVPLILIYTAPAHTASDMIVFLPGEKIVFAGDLLTPEIAPYPGIHLHKHGSSLGWIESAKAMLALEADIFISGHGKPMSRDEVAASIAATETRRAGVKRLVEEHRTLEEVKRELKDVPLPGLAGRFPTFVETTYQELTRQ